MAIDASKLAPYLRLVHDFKTPVGMTFGPAATLDHALHYFKRGEGRYCIAGGEYAISAGTVFFVRPGVRFEFEAAVGTSFHMLNVHFDPVELDDSALVQAPYPRAGETRLLEDADIIGADADGIDSIPWYVRVQNPTEFEWQFARMHACNGLQDAASRLVRRSAMLDILALVYRSASGADFGGPAPRPDMADAMRYIQEHFCEPIRLSDMADAACLSPSHFSAIFKSAYGVSPQKLVITMRVEKAKGDLTMTSAPVKEIAAACGFDSIHHFTRTFTQYTGVPPARFRRLSVHTLP